MKVDVGGYSCVYTPYMSCTNLEKESNKYISKLVTNNNRMRNGILRKEYLLENSSKSKVRLFDYRDYMYEHKDEYISHFIRSIPEFNNYFKPILDQCGLTIDKIRTHNSAIIDNCPIIKRTQQNNNVTRKNKFINYKVERVPNGLTMDEFYSTSSISSLKKRNSLYYNYITLCNQIKLMIERNILHHDLKTSNIIINYKTIQPYIIDFGISAYMKEPYFAEPLRFIKKLCGVILPSSKLEQYQYENSIIPFRLYCSLLYISFFLKSPSQVYSIWDIERHIISMIVTTFSYEDIQELEDDIKEENSSIQSKFINPFSKTEYKRKMKDIVNTIIDKHDYLKNIYKEQREKNVSKCINALREIMIEPFGDYEYEELSCSDMILMVHSLIQRCWKTWDIYTVTLYQQHMFMNYLSQDEMVNTKAQQIFYKVLHPDPRERYDNLDELITDYKNIFSIQS